MPSVLLLLLDVAFLDAGRFFDCSPLGFRLLLQTSHLSSPLKKSASVFCACQCRWADSRQGKGFDYLSERMCVEVRFPLDRSHGADAGGSSSMRVMASPTSLFVVKHHQLASSCPIGDIERFFFTSKDRNSVSHH